MHLMRGKWGRFYKCWRFDCEGTLGARLDGTPRSPKAPPELLVARPRARDAVQLVCIARDEQARRRVTELRAITGPWWNEPHDFATCTDEFKAIVLTAGLGPIYTHRDKRSYWKDDPVRLFLRRRSIEECDRVVEAARGVLRRVRRNAWDHVFDETLDVIASHHSSDSDNIGSAGKDTGFGMAWPVD